MRAPVGRGGREGRRRRRRRRCRSEPDAPTAGAGVAVLTAVKMRAGTTMPPRAAIAGSAADAGRELADDQLALDLQARQQEESVIVRR